MSLQRDRGLVAMTNQDVVRGVRMIRQVEGFELFPDLVRLLAEGKPVAIHRLAEASGRSESDVAAALAEHPSAEWDDEGRIVGFGLTLRPTPHRFTFDDKTVYGWCASDTLIFPMLLDTAGVVESTCPATGRPIRVELDPDAVRRVDPPEAVVSEVRPQERVSDVRTEVCGLGHFFSSRDAAGEWLATHPEGQVLSVSEDFVLNRHVLDKLGWVEVDVESG